MKKMSLSLLALFCGAIGAQTITSLQLEKPSITVGQSAKATINLEGERANCGLRIDWGDGQGDDIKINDPKLIPFVTQHSYIKPGDYRISVTGQKVTSHLGCVGKNKSAVLKVAASALPVIATAPLAPAAPLPVPMAAATQGTPPIAAPAASPLVPPPPVSAPAVAVSAVKAAPNAQCPAGWKLDAKSVNKKTQAYQCTAPSGTATPTTKWVCPGDLGYFENSKKGVLGCRA